MNYVMYGKWIVGNAVVKLLEYIGEKVILMDDADRDDVILVESDYIIMTAWITPQSEIYQTYKDKLIGELDLCWNILEKRGLLDRVRFYCITGTNGKSTTTWMLYNAFKELRLRAKTNDKVYVCGNFEPAVSQVILEIVQQSLWDNLNMQYHLVTEISSFMCHYIHDFTADDSIITNLAPDHLNRHSDLDDYRQTKLNLFTHTKYNCITDDEVKKYTGDNNLISYKHKVIDLSKTQFIGKHNADNFAAVYSLMEWVCERNGRERNDELFYNLIQSVEPLWNRCRKSLVIDGIQFIDDLHALGTHAQTAALGCVDGELILICGWKEAGEDYSVMKEKYTWKVKAAVIIGKEWWSFADIFDDITIPYHHTADMKTGLLQAISYAKEYNLKTILYSPGAKWFDLFNNRWHRAKVFQEELGKLPYPAMQKVIIIKCIWS